MIAGVVPFLKGTVFTVKTAKKLGKAFAVGVAVTGAFQAAGDAIDNRAVRTVNKTRRDLYEDAKAAGVYTDEELARLESLIGDEAPKRTAEEILKEAPIRGVRRLTRAVIATLGADLLVYSFPLWLGSTLVRTAISILGAAFVWLPVRLWTKNELTADHAHATMMRPVDAVNSFVWRWTFHLGWRLAKAGDDMPVAPPRKPKHERGDKETTFDSTRADAQDNNVKRLLEVHKVVIKDMGADNYQDSPELYGRRMASQLAVDLAKRPDENTIDDYRMAFQVHLTVVRMPLPNQVVAIDSWDSTIERMWRAADDGVPVDA